MDRVEGKYSTGIRISKWFSNRKVHRARVRAEMAPIAELHTSLKKTLMAVGVVKSPLSGKL